MWAKDSKRRRDINTLHLAKQDTITKRQLPTTVSSPERSPAVKKVLKIHIKNMGCCLSKVIAMFNVLSKDTYSVPKS